MKPSQLKTLREKLGLTQAQLAEAIGVRTNTVYRWEAGIHPVSAMAAKLLMRLVKGK